MYPRLPEDCPTCNGFVYLEKTDEFVKSRVTVGMMCMTCGTNCGPPDDKEKSNDSDFR